MKKVLPSGSGKSTVEKLLCENGFSKVISHTTREMRAGEINGVDYFYISKEEFDSLDQKGEFKMKKVLLLVGPSGSGKSTVEKILVNLGEFTKVISHTTRDMRANEINGVDYFYISKEEFDSLDQKGEFIEGVIFGGNYYGVHSSQVTSSDKPAVIVVEPHGAQQITKWGSENNIKVITAYLDISKENQIKRMSSRGDDTQLIQKRIEIDNIEENAKHIHIDIKINTEVLNEVGVAKILSCFFNEVI